MIKLASISIRAIQILIEILALFSPIILWNVLLFEHLLHSMSESTLNSKSTLALHFPVPAHFCFELLLEIVLRGNLKSWFHCFYFLIVIIIVSIYIIVIFLFLYNLLLSLVPIVIYCVHIVHGFVGLAFGTAHILRLKFFIKETEIFCFMQVTLGMQDFI